MARKTRGLRSMLSAFGGERAPGPKSRPVLIQRAGVDPAGKPAREKRRPAPLVERDPVVETVPAAPEVAARPRERLVKREELPVATTVAEPSPSPELKVIDTTGVLPRLLGVGKAITAVDLSAPHNFLFTQTLKSLSDAQVDLLEKSNDRSVSVMRVLSDLGLQWEDHGLYARPKHLLPGAAENPIVVIGQASDTETDAGVDDLIDLARAENPGAPVIYCGSGTTGASLDDDRVDYSGFALGDALAVAARAYTVSSASGMDALLRDVPLTVTGQPLYSGLGFTDDRSASHAADAKLTFSQFFSFLCLLAEMDAFSGEAPSNFHQVLSSIFNVFGGNAALKRTLTQFDDILAPSKAPPPASRVARHRRAVKRAARLMPVLSGSGHWPVLIVKRIADVLNSGTRDACLAKLISTDVLRPVENARVRRVIARTLVGACGKKGERLTDLLAYLGRTLDENDFRDLVRDYAQISGTPIGVLADKAGGGDWASQPDDILHAAVKLAAGPSARANASLITWARTCFDRRDMASAERLLDMYLLLGFMSPRALDLVSEIFWQSYDFEAASELLVWAGEAYPTWLSGRFHWRAAYASAVSGRLDRVLPNIADSAIINEVSLDRLEFVQEQISARYPGIDIADALEAYVLKDGPNQNPAKAARYLIKQNRPVEAEQVLLAADDVQKSVRGYVVELTYALALQGRHAEARQIIEEAIATRLDEVYVSQAMKLAYFSGDARWASSMLMFAREKGLPVSSLLERQVMLCAGDLAGALESEKSHVVLDLAKPYLRNRHVGSLAALTEGTGKKLLVALINGPADDIRWAAVFPKLAAACVGHSLSVTCDPRLHSLLSRSFPDITFIPSRRVRNSLPALDDKEALPAVELQKVFDGAGWAAALEADRVSLITDLAGDLIMTPEAVDNRPYLIPDPERVEYWRDRLASYQRPLVGIAWRSMRREVLRNYDYLRVEDVRDLVEGSDVTFVNLQYFDVTDELASLERSHPGRVIHFDDLDQMNDIEGVVALMACLDLVISPTSTPLILSAASGRPSWYCDPAMANKYWGRFTRKETDYWFGASVYVNGDHPGDRAGVVKRLCRGLAEFKDKATYEAGVANIEALIEQEPPTAEAEAFAYRRVILDAEESLLADRLYRDHAYWSLRARVFDRLEIRRDAAECWAQACAQSRISAPGDLLANWKANMLIGRDDLALRYGPLDPALLDAGEIALFEELKRDKLSHDRSSDGLRLLAAGRSRSAMTKFHEAVDASAGDNEKSREALHRIVERFGEALGNLTLEKGTRRDISMPVMQMPSTDSYNAFASPTGGDVSGSAPRSIICAGYMYSGSGAVADYLRQSPQTVVPGQGDGEQNPYDTELNVFRRFYGVQHLLDAPIDEIEAQHLGEFLLGSVLGLVGHPSDLHRLDLARKRSLRRAFEANDRIDELEQLCDVLLSALRNRQVYTGEAIVAAARQMCNALAPKFATPDRRVVVWNNCIQGHNARTLAVLDRTLMIAVSRDPRDQFVSQCCEWTDGYGKNSVKKFIRRTQQHQRLKAQRAEIVGLNDRILDMRFEDIVTKPAARLEALGFAGLSLDGFEDERHFKPEISRKNIGIHRTFHDQMAIREIARAFPELLWEG